VKNILIERLTSQIIQRFKKKFEKKISKKFKLKKKKFKLYRQGYAEDKTVGIDYAESSSYADGQMELRRGASTPRSYADGN
jgi:hypothetical protein